MKHFKQEQNYGCGLYALANAFQDNWPLTEENLKREINGGNIGKLNQYLFETNQGCYISYVCYNNEKPIELIDLVNESWNEPFDEYWYPFFIVVKSTETKNHIICCRYMKDRTIIVHDSLKDNPETYKTYNDFENAYKHKIIYSIEALYMLDSGMATIIFNK